MALSLKGAVGLLSQTPTALFPISLGFAGLSAAFVAAANVTNSSALLDVSNTLMSAAAFVLVSDLVLYFLKLMRARGAVRSDWEAASSANLIAPGFMSAMVIGSLCVPIHWLGEAIWLTATLGHLTLIIGFVGRWLSHEFVSDELNPTWFLPAAGIMTAAMTWPDNVPMVVPLISLSIGAVLWLMLLPLVFRRLVFEPPVTPEIRPTLFIIAAPFGLLAGALMTLYPNVSDTAAQILLFAGAFFITVLVSRIRFLGEARITLSWWATTFPISVVSSGFFRIADSMTDLNFFIAILLLIIAILTTVIAIAATVRAAWRTCAKTVSETKKQISAMLGEHQSTSDQVS